MWYGFDGQAAGATGLAADALFANPTFLRQLADARAVRLLGTRANAPLVIKLFERRAADPDFRAVSVRLGSPAAVPGAWLRADPEAVLHALWQPPAAGGLAGQWHELGPTDYPGYAMAAALAAAPAGDVPEVVRRIAEHHPAWPAVSFVGSVDAPAACRLLAEIVDARWFQHPSRPGRPSRLLAYLGVTPDNTAAMSGAPVKPGRHFNRATTAVGAWYNQRVRRGSREPRDFLVRCLDAHAALGAGLLAGTRRFLGFVTAVWLAAVRPRHPEAAFDAERFFRDAAVARAYEAHRAAATKV